VVNDGYAFRNAFRPLSVGQRFRLRRPQLFERLRIQGSALRVCGRGFRGIAQKEV